MSAQTSSHKAMPYCLLLSGLALLIFIHQTQWLSSAQDFQPSEDQEILYLPKKEALHALSFGYQQALADILWMSTVNYFGKHFQSDKKYTWLLHRCELVLELDPRSLAPARFCSAMLSWEAGKPEKSEELLTKLLQKHDSSWEVWSLRGFTRLLFLKNHKGAGEDFRRSAALPGAPVLVKRLATRDLAAQNPDDAIVFIQEMLRTATSTQEKKALEERLKEAVFLSLAQKIEQANKRYFQQYGRFASSLEDLEKAGLARFHNLQDPFGGKLSVAPDTGELLSSKWKKKKIGHNEQAVAERIEKWKLHEGEQP